MKIQSINSFSYQNYLNPSFEGRGKPISLKYIVEKRANLVPPQILEQAQSIVARTPETTKSLKELHLERYTPLLEYTSMDAVRTDFPEFAYMADAVVFKRDSVYKQQFEETTKDINFPLKMLQELWVNLKTKDEVAQELGLPNRSSLDWALKQIGFVYYPPNYRTLLKASDEEGNREIAQKTQAYNAAHPDLMYARNRHAAQGCKTPEYRAAQRERMLEHDKLHPERREKISEFDRRTWELCPEIREALSRFTAGESAYVRQTVAKVIQNMSISDCESRARRGFFKRFWDAHPELKEVLAAAKAQVRKEMGKE
ncbi:MAG: hypothetical protein NC408_05425 [Candidatus Gastranaerophilales bacterium]|nr:hypothetical protein [Candidatus Gastranaerophilales bacterium]MCM1073167.1 hypothetical protein [Bacteroides sp.]